eukprot:CAMPEP_0196995776 /NCGR_PEP_ID=MMETSP1380-20130617/1826_1 /TAXON_ID=5936 /ORGANISM="Euplotes crassus, Strain CT5" /LENGTH=162 /DNA_ID=CAMNT_0042411557 /DNA_START=65 /DNA_END=553 /DNA_ORIENTATION=-
MFELGRTSKDVEEYTKIARSGLQSFMEEFYSPEDHSLTAECLGEEFQALMVKIVDGIKNSDNLLTLIITQGNNIMQVGRMTRDSCQVSEFMSDLESKCHRGKCKIIKIVERLEEHKMSLFSYGMEIYQILNSEYATLEEQVADAGIIGKDLSKITRIALAMD